MTARANAAPVGGMHYHLEHFPDSFVSKYLREYQCGSRRAVACCNGTCVRGYADPAPALADLISRETRALPDRRERGGEGHVAAVHIRAGDVLDRSPYSVDQMLARPTRVSWKCPGETMACGVGMDVQPLQYAQTRDHWARVIVRSLRALHVSRVTIVSGSHYNLSDLPPPRFGKSCAYISAVGAIFAASNFSVRYRLGYPPDDDLIFVSRVRALAPSVGGFATMMSEAVARIGVHVVNEVV